MPRQNIKEIQRVCVRNVVTYIDAGCRRVEFFSRDGFIRSYDGFYGEGRQQERFFKFPFESSRPGGGGKKKKEKENEKKHQVCGCFTVLCIQAAL